MFAGALGRGQAGGVLSWEMNSRGTWISWENGAKQSFAPCSCAKWDGSMLPAGLLSISHSVLRWADGTGKAWKKKQHKCIRYIHEDGRGPGIHLIHLSPC